MTGNVYEVCWDNYQRYYYSTLPQLSINPTGPATSQFENGKLIRGGAFWDTEPDTNAGRASMSVLVRGQAHTGFRIVIRSGR